MKTRFRWLIAVLILLATTINYIDRQAISIAESQISKEFGLDAQGYSWIIFWFLLSYALMQAVTGKVIDKIGAKRGFSLSVIWWSIANMLHAFGSGVVSLSIYRFLLGIGEAGNFPAASKAISRWFPASERSIAFGILTAGPGLGAIIAPPLLAILILNFGWRMAFVITGLLGFVWWFAWQFLYDEPETSKFPNEAEKQFIVADRSSEEASTTNKSWFSFFRYREVWGLMLSRFIGDGAFYFFLFFLPKYLSDVRGFDLKQIGASAWFPFLAADIGSIFGGWLSGYLIKKGWSLNASRKTIMWIGAIGVPFAIPALYADSGYSALALIGVAMFFIQFKQAALFTVPNDLFASKHVATVWGISGMAGSLGGMAFAPVIGYLIKNISYTPVFIIVSLMHIISVLFVVFLIPRIRNLEIE
jgi:MFS transporter, ACS family, hexuronate transporter